MVYQCTFKSIASGVNGSCGHRYRTTNLKATTTHLLREPPSKAMPDRSITRWVWLTDNHPSSSLWSTNCKFPSCLQKLLCLITYQYKHLLDKFVSRMRRELFYKDSLYRSAFPHRRARSSLHPMPYRIRSSRDQLALCRIRSSGLLIGRKVITVQRLLQSLNQVCHKFPTTDRS